MHTPKCVYLKSKLTTLKPTTLTPMCLCPPENKAAHTISVCIFEHVGVSLNTE